MSRSMSDHILERSLLGALAALVPVPFVDDFLLRRARTTLIRELAERSRLRLDAASLDAFTSDRKASRVRELGVGLVTRTLRRAAIPLRLAGRAHAALETFQLATLLDHYAREHHRGLDLDVERARALRAVFEEVISATPVGLAGLRSPAQHAEALRTSFDAHMVSHAGGAQ